MPRTDTASRLIAAPPELVFGAFIDPDALAAWLPPDGMSARLERWDLRPGGSYRLVLTYADPSLGAGKATADTDIIEARFIDVAPGVRLVQEVDFVSDDPAFAGTMTMTWQVTPVDGATRVDFVAHDVPDGISAEDHVVGLASSLANPRRLRRDVARRPREATRCGSHPTVVVAVAERLWPTMTHREDVEWPGRVSRCVLRPAL
ncbi:MAG: ATPase [Acidimicrobiia bacterium]|nr:ATPase [Acidimicrobiia bacterium]